VSIKEHKIVETYLIICNDEADKVLQERLWRKWWNLRIGDIASIVVGHVI